MRLKKSYEKHFELKSEDTYHYQRSPFTQFKTHRSCYPSKSNERDYGLVRIGKIFFSF